MKLLLNRPVLWLLAILFLALSLRLWGIGFGLPYVGYQEDEAFLTDGALGLLRKEKLDFSQWDIGMAHVYLQAAVGQAVFMAQELDPAAVPTYQELRAAKGVISTIGIPYPVPEYYFGGRAVVAILGAGSVIPLYLIGQVTKSSRVGLVSAFFLAVMPAHIEQSHYLARAAPALFFLLLTAYVMLQAYLKQSWRLYFLSLVLAYLAIAMKQNNLILLVPLGLGGSFIAWRTFTARSFKETAQLSLTVLGIGLVIAMLDWGWFDRGLWNYGQNIYQRIFLNSYVYGGYHFGFSGDNTFLWILEQFFTDPRATWRIVAFLALPGLILAARLKMKGWFILSLLVPYMVVVSMFTVRFFHWLIPVIPFLALLAALTLDWIYETLENKNIFTPGLRQAGYTLIVILISAASLRNAIILDYYSSQTDVRQTAGVWLADNLPRGSKVVIDLWGPYLSHSDYEVIYVDSIGSKSLADYRAEGVDYLILNSFNLARIIAARSDTRAAQTVARQTDRLDQIIQELPLEREFVGPALFSPPVVSIFVYRIPDELF